MSSYFLFMNDRRTTLGKTHPSMTGFGEKTKHMTAEWKQLTEKERIKWEKAAQEDKNRYARETKDYKPSATANDSKAKSQGASKQKVADESAPAEKKK